jgi:glycosyltransferase involved in cell wall biosynthesis
VPAPRVLMLGRYGHPNDVGGVANAMKHIIRSAVGEGITFDLVSLRSEKAITSELLNTADYGLEQVTLNILPPTKGFSSRKNDWFDRAMENTSNKVLCALKGAKVDVVHVFTTYPNYLGVGEKIAEKLRVPFMVSARGTGVYGHNPEYNYDPDKGWYIRPLTAATLIIALSTFLANEVAANLQEAGKSLVPYIIHNGADLSTFKPLEKQGIPPDSLRVVYTGRIRRFKGVLDIVQAVHDARQQGVDVEFDIYGPSDEGNVVEGFREIHTYVEGNGLGDVVRCTGEYVDNASLPERYRAHNLFMYASRCEGLPNATMEAMACGLPVALNYPSGSVDLLDDAEMMFQTGDVKQMTGILCRLAKSPKKLQTHGIRNRAFMERQHDWKHIADKYCKVYDAVLSNRVHTL